MRCGAVLIFSVAFAVNQGKEVSDRLAEAETERACQEVALTTLKAQVLPLLPSLLPAAASWSLLLVGVVVVVLVGAVFLFGVLSSVFDPRGCHCYSPRHCCRPILLLQAESPCRTCCLSPPHFHRPSFPPHPLSHNIRRGEQLEELRRGAAAGDAALREAAKLKKVLEGALQQPTSAPNRSSDADSPAAATDTGTAVPATATAGTVSGKGGLRVPGGVIGTGHRAGIESLVDLAERLLRRADSVDRELEAVRDALTTARCEIGEGDCVRTCVGVVVVVVMVH